MKKPPTPGTERPRTEPSHEKYFVWFVLFLTALTYLGTVRFGFLIYDDDPQIVSNPVIRAWHYVPQYFFSSVWMQIAPLFRGNYYRPLFLLSLRIGYALFGLRPLGWHLLAIGMHLVASWLTYLLVKRLTGQFTTAWLTALIFGVHPIHHEVIAWVSGTTESLCAILFLLSFLAFLRSREGSKALWMSASCALYALALLSKETAIILPVLLFAYGWIADRPVAAQPDQGFTLRFRRAFAPTIFYLPVALLYLVVRNYVLSGLGHARVSVSFVSWFLTLPSILLFYLRNWFLPFRLAEFYDVLYQSRPGAAGVVLPALALVLAAVAVWTLRNRLGAKATGYAVALIVIPILPALDTFVFRADELVHDRYFYVPSIGAALLLALFIQWVARSRPGVFGQPTRVVMGGLAVALLLASFAGYAAGFWSSDYALFSRAHRIAPGNATATNNLAVEMITRHELAPAQELLETGYRNHPGDFRFPLNLGRLYYSEGQYPQAEALVARVRELEPGLADSYVLLSQVQLKQGRPKEAQATMRQAALLSPYSAQVHAIYGIVLAANGDCESADHEFQAALALNPGDAFTQVQMNRCKAALAASAFKHQD
jgi:protein O-mannosyl-transferase